MALNCNRGPHAAVVALALLTACENATQPSAPTAQASMARTSVSLAPIGTLTATYLAGGSGLTPIAAHALNELGQVAGTANSPDSWPHAVIWTGSGLMRQLDAPGEASDAWGINRLGQVVGEVYLSTNLYQARAFLWSAANGRQDLGTLPGCEDMWALGVNDLGQVVGLANCRTDYRAFLWSAAKGLQDIGTLPGCTGAEARAINDLGQVVGIAYCPDPQAFVWTAGTGMKTLGSLPGGLGTAEAHAINNLGQITGIAWGKTAGSDQFYTHPVLWDATGVHDITPASYPWQWGVTGLGVNDLGQVVGGTQNGIGAAAFVWTAAGGLQELIGNATGYAINDLGQIAGMINGRAVVWK